MTHLSISTQFK